MSNLTEEQMKEILTDVESYIDVKLSKYSWKIISFMLIPLVLVSVAWGMLTTDVKKNTAMIENSVLTIKDKDNIEIQIKAIDEKMDTSDERILKAIDRLGDEIKNLK